MCVVDQAEGRIGDPHFGPSNLVDDDEVIAFPMRNAGERRFVAQPLEAEPHWQRAKAEPLCCFGNAEQIRAASADLAEFPQALVGQIPPKCHTDHPQRSGSAIHRVKLCMEGKPRLHAMRAVEVVVLAEPSYLTGPDFRTPSSHSLTATEKIGNRLTRAATKPA